MKKYIIFCSLLALTITSCNNDDATGHSNLLVTEPTASISAAFSTSSVNVVAEPIDSDSEILYNISATLTEKQSVDVVLHLVLENGTATEGRDFELTDIVIPAYSLTGSGSIKILSDNLTEAEETFTVSIGKNTENVNFTQKSASFTIKNYISNELHLDFIYNKSFSISGTNLTLCGILYDLDFYLLDANGDDTGIYDAAGSNCEESLILDETLADGTYYILPQLYDNGDFNGGSNTSSDGFTSTYHDPFIIPISIHYFKQGGINAGSMELDEVHYASSTQTPAQYNNTATPILQIVKSTVSGIARFELINFDTELTVANGRMAQRNFTINRIKN